MAKNPKGLKSFGSEFIRTKNNLEKNKLTIEVKKTKLNILSIEISFLTITKSSLER
jgi:hypothetical protein